MFDRGNKKLGQIPSKIVLAREIILASRIYQRKIGHVEQTISDLMRHELDGRTKLASEESPLHRIPELNLEHYNLISKTPEGETAFNNLTCNHCSYYHDPTKMTKKERKLQTKCNNCNKFLDVPKIEVNEWICAKCSKFNGKFKRKCQDKKCGHPRNGVKSKKFWRTINGFMTSYRRMKWDEPANTITTTSHNFTSD